MELHHRLVRPHRRAVDRLLRPRGLRLRRRHAAARARPRRPRTPRLINTIGPVWDGNEVWLIIAGGATFAAFPEWYATLFSGFYLPLLLILRRADRARGRLRVPRQARRRRLATPLGPRASSSARSCRRCCGASRSPTSCAACRSTPSTSTSAASSTCSTRTRCSAALTTLRCSLTHGAVFLALKTDGRHPARAPGGSPAGSASAPPSSRSAFLRLDPLTTGTARPPVAARRGARRRAARRRSPPTGPAGRAGRSRHRRRHRPRPWPTPVRRAVPGRHARPPSTRPARLTVTNASSTPYTLKIMTWVAVVFTPLVLVYQGWTYWVFRRRIGVQPHPGGRWSSRPSRRPVGEALRPTVRARLAPARWPARRPAARRAGRGLVAGPAFVVTGFVVALLARDRAALTWALGVVAVLSGRAGSGMGRRRRRCRAAARVADDLRARLVDAVLARRGLRADAPDRGGRGARHPGRRGGGAVPDSLRCPPWCWRPCCRP